MSTLETMVDMFFKIEDPSEQIQSISEDMQKILSGGTIQFENNVRSQIEQIGTLANVAIANLKKAQDGLIDMSSITNYAKEVDTIIGSLHEKIFSLIGGDITNINNLTDEQKKSLIGVVQLYRQIYDQASIVKKVVEANNLKHKELTGIIRSQKGYLNELEKALDDNIKKTKEHKEVWSGITTNVSEYYKTINAIGEYCTKITELMKEKPQEVFKFTLKMIARIADEMFDYLNRMDKEFHRLIYGVVSDSNDLWGRSYRLVSLTNKLAADTGLQFDNIKSSIKAIAEVGGVAGKHFEKVASDVSIFTHMTNVSEATTARFIAQLEKMGGEKGLETATKLLGDATVAMKKYGLSTADVSAFLETMSDATINLMALSASQEKATKSVHELGKQYLMANSILKKTMGGMKELGQIFKDATSPLDALNSKFLILYARSGALQEFLTGRGSEGIKKITENFEQVEKRLKKMSPVAREAYINMEFGSKRAYLETKKLNEEVKKLGGWNEYQKQMDEAADLQEQFADATHNLGMIMRRILLPILNAINAVLRPFIPLLKTIGMLISKLASGITILSSALEKIPVIGPVLSALFGAALIASIFKFHKAIFFVLTWLPKQLVKIVARLFGVKKAMTKVATAGEEMAKKLGQLKVDKLKPIDFSKVTGEIDTSKITTPLNKAKTTIVDKVKSIGTSIGKHLKDVGGKIKDFAANAGDKLGKLGGKALEGLKSVGTSLVGFVGNISAGFAKINWMAILKFGAMMAIIVGGLVILFWAIDKYNITPEKLLSLAAAFVGFAILMTIASILIVQVGKILQKGLIYVVIFVFTLLAISVSLYIIGKAFEAFGTGFEKIANSIGKLAEVNLIAIGISFVIFAGLMMSASIMALLASFGLSSFGSALEILIDPIEELSEHLKTLELLNNILSYMARFNSDAIDALTESMKKFMEAISDINISSKTIESIKPLLNLSSAISALKAPDSDSINKGINSIISNIISHKADIENASNILGGLFGQETKPAGPVNLQSKSGVSLSYTPGSMKVEFEDKTKELMEDIKSNTNDIKDINDNIKQFVNSIDGKITNNFIFNIARVRWL